MFEYFTQTLWSPYVAGAGIFTEIYPLAKTRILRWGKFSAVTVPELLNLNLWIVIILMEGLMIGFLLLLEYSGL
jgi:hypothetical protein